MEWSLGKTPSVKAMRREMWVLVHFSPVAKQLWCEAGHPRLSSVEVKNMCCCTSTPLCLHGVILH